MRTILSIVMLLGVQIGMGQITKNPKVEKKTSQDTYINRIEITDDYTVVSMQYVSKSAKEQLKDYLNANPDEKEQLSRMNPMMRDMLLQQMMQQMGGSTISIQPTSYLKAGDGRKFNFIKASNIPVAPERQEVEPEKKYFFKVYFSKLDPGIQSIDLVENEEVEDGGFHYWNFYGVEVNNPASGVQALVPETEAPEEPASVSFLLSGKVLDAETNQPVSAKIICDLDGEEQAYDSLYTSRSGYYEFLLKPGSFVYHISAPGYEDYEQSLDLSFWKKDIEQNFYLEPVKQEVNIEPEEKIEKEIEDLELVDAKTIRLNNVYFPTGKAEIINNSYRELDKLVKMMREKPEMRIRVDGHTDNQGDSEKNKELSQKRAEAVKTYLVEKGIDEERITCKGWGDTKPVAKNSTESSRQKNRRVEITIL